MKLVHPASLAETLDAVNEAFFTGAKPSRPERVIGEGVRELKKALDEGGGWRTFPFWYTLLALSEIEGAAAKAPPIGCPCWSWMIPSGRGAAAMGAGRGWSTSSTEEIYR